MIKKFFFLFSLIVFIFSFSFLLGNKKFTDNSKLNAVDKHKWEKKILEFRNNKDIEFKNSSTSPLAGTSRLIALKDSKYYLIKKNKRFVFSKKKVKNIFFSVNFTNKKWVLGDMSHKIRCFKDKIEIKSGENLLYRSLIKIDKYTLLIYPLKKYLIATLFDPEREILKKFKGLKYYPPNYKYYINAQISSIRKPKKVIMLTSRNLEKTFYRSAIISFEIESKKYRLFAYSSSLNKADSKILFIPFTDKTTGKETYYTGRYLEIAEPKGKNFKIDFNLLFNPLCNYSPAYNCPIPPSENNLNIKIEAGEKTYPVKKEQ